MSKEFEEATKIYNQLSDVEKDYLCPDGEFRENSNEVLTLVYKDVYNDNELMGFINANDTAYFHIPHYPSLKMTYLSLAILPNYRGRGLAEKMIKDMIISLRVRGYDLIRYQVSKNNYRSVRCAIKNGFTYASEDRYFYYYNLKLK